MPICTEACSHPWHAPDVMPPAVSCSQTITICNYLLDAAYYLQKALTESCQSTSELLNCWNTTLFAPRDREGERRAKVARSCTNDEPNTLRVLVSYPCILLYPRFAREMSGHGP